MKPYRICLIAALLSSPQAIAQDIAGFWKHADEPGWIEISLEEGKGTVVRNDKFPERVGREIMKDLATENPEQAVWKGQIYAEKLGEYKDAEITLADPDRMSIKVKVGFISRTVEWQRVEAIPAKPEN